MGGRKATHLVKLVTNFFLLSCTKAHRAPAVNKWLIQYANAIVATERMTELNTRPERKEAIAHAYYYTVGCGS